MKRTPQRRIQNSPVHSLFSEKKISFGVNIINQIVISNLENDQSYHQLISGSYYSIDKLCIIFVHKLFFFFFFNTI